MVVWYVFIMFCLLQTYHGTQEVGEGLVMGHHVLHDDAEAGPLPGLPRPGHRITPPVSAELCWDGPLTSLALHLDSFWSPAPAPLCWHQEAASVYAHPGLARAAHTGLDTTTTSLNWGTSLVILPDFFCLGLGI